MSSRFDQSIPEGVLERAKVGDRAAQAELYAAFGQPVFGLARRMLGRADLADDVLQETFIEVLKGLPKFRGEAPLGMWIRRIAVNECLMQLRSHWHRYRIPLNTGSDSTPMEEWLTSDDPPPDKGLDVERALDALSPEARVVVWLHDVEGYTHVEIARLMHATPSFSKSQLARAYVRMRQWAGRPDEVEPCMPVLNS
ncbi:MAG TPA: RNA polymerase sigma factor [Gammaproteobacteria bacterium]|jgi:RNA polymerase sigma-70 factor (ECF subfamily)